MAYTTPHLQLSGSALNNICTSDLSTSLGISAVIEIVSKYAPFEAKPANPQLSGHIRMPSALHAPQAVISYKYLSRY
jgi:hypothetical protein